MTFVINSLDWSKGKMNSIVRGSMVSQPLRLQLIWWKEGHRFWVEWCKKILDGACCFESLMRRLTTREGCCPPLWVDMARVLRNYCTGGLGPLKIFMYVQVCFLQFPAKALLHGGYDAEEIWILVKKSSGACFQVILRGCSRWWPEIALRALFTRNNDTVPKRLNNFP